MLNLLRSAATLAVALAALPASAIASVGAAVDTSSGRIIGHSAPNATEVSEYLGIPFAKKPTGKLRFAPPVAYHSSRTFNASHYAADCVCVGTPLAPGLAPRLVNLLGDLAQANDTVSEDCLFLNVWTKPQTGSRRKPVLLWIYGGGFNFGGTDVRAYSGQYFAETEDVVVVSVNYRTNIFGFSGAPNITQNVGLLDQRMGVEWVRDNIDAFGGDPDRITIFGQSAGGASVDYYSYAWTKDPIVAGTILHSGTGTAFAPKAASAAASSWYTAAEKVGCASNTTTTSPAAVLHCMRSCNITSEVLEAAANAGSGLSSLLGNFGPTVDETVIFSNYTEKALAGEYIKKPTLVGNCNYEAGLFSLIADGTGEVLPDSFWDSFTSVGFTCPASFAAKYRAAEGVPTWRYFYSGMYPNLLIPTVNISQAWHTSDIPTLFGTSQDSSGADSTWQQRAFGNYIRGAWAAFASQPECALTDIYGWPQYSPTAQTLILLGQNNETVARYGYPADVDGACGS